VGLFSVPEKGAISYAELQIILYWQDLPRLVWRKGMIVVVIIRNTIRPFLFYFLTYVGIPTAWSQIMLSARHNKIKRWGKQVVIPVIFFTNKLCRLTGSSGFTHRVWPPSVSSHLGTVHLLLGIKLQALVFKLGRKSGNAFLPALIVCVECRGKEITGFWPMLAFMFGLRTPSANMDLGNGTIRTFVFGLSATVLVTPILRLIFPDP
jgi:hypothetical protein